MPPSDQNADLSREHAELLAALEDTGRLLKSLDRSHRKVDRQLGRLAELIESHFTHEENGGYMAEPLARAPRLTTTARQLLGEHAELLDDAKKLQMLARFGVESDGWWRQVEHDFQRLHKRLLAHEHAENKLLHDAWNQDVGAADLRTPEARSS
jgi:hypothetical protein